MCSFCNYVQGFVCRVIQSLSITNCRSKLKCQCLHFQQKDSYFKFWIHTIILTYEMYNLDLPVIVHIMSYPEYHYCKKKRVSLSIFGVQTRLRSLHSYSRPHARNAPKTSPFPDLKDLFCRFFRRHSPLILRHNDTIQPVYTDFWGKILSVTFVNFMWMNLYSVWDAHQDPVCQNWLISVDQNAT